ncbi:MAG: AraC family transcriptional regulator [Desulfobacter sp.]|nr:MAG: AraC family transcriptional regulator [Desulfobacter sp.]
MCPSMVDAAHKNKIDRVVDHIQANLDSKLTVKDLSRIACFSEFHFSRIFKAFMGESVYRFIRRLRLEKAAELLAARPGLSVTDVAFMCGFGSSAAFAKSFKSHFKVSAGQWRDRCSKQFPEGLEKNDPSCQIHFSRGAPVWNFPLEDGMRRVCLEQIPSLKVAYLRYVGPYQEDEELFDGLYRRLFHWALPKGFLTEAPQRFNIFHDNPEITPGGKLRVMAAIPVPGSILRSDAVGLFTLSGGLYGICRLQLKAGQFVNEWKWMFESWLASSGYELDNREMLERYRGEKLVEGQRVFDVDICIPVKAK